VTDALSESGAGRIWRVVFDTSTLVSAALRVGSVPHQALQQALSTCTLCASEETLGELETVLGRDKFDAYLDRESRRAFAALIRRNAQIFVVEESDLALAQPPCRDPRDMQFLAVAQVAEADALVSSDDDLLVLHPWREIDILTPLQFVARRAK
jgi:putative PIN family toxin of toxin-antitoxin system